MQAPNGQRLKLTLPDGTGVQLNSGSVIEYPSVFGKDVRRIRLSGEAMFDVTHNEEQPFVVETFASDIRVLGTRFNVVANENASDFPRLCSRDVSGSPTNSTRPRKRSY